jgi:hypothetical protein
MADDIISFFAPLLFSDVTVEDALARGEAANSFAVVEELEGTFRLHPIEALESAAQRLGMGVRLGNLVGDDVKLHPVEPHEADEASALRRLGADVAIEKITVRGGGAEARIIGLSGVDRYLGRMTVGTTWYQCGNVSCPDTRRRRKSGTCGYGHPLVKKP